MRYSALSLWARVFCDEQSPFVATLLIWFALYIVLMRWTVRVGPRPNIVQVCE
jgi:antibiotic biosynthesis monooxygenase (ABM) superfamily enzyme